MPSIPYLRVLTSALHQIHHSILLGPQQEPEPDSSNPAWSSFSSDDAHNLPALRFWRITVQRTVKGRKYLLESEPAES